MHLPLQWRCDDRCASGRPRRRSMGLWGWRVVRCWRLRPHYLSRGQRTRVRWCLRRRWCQLGHVWQRKYGAQMNEWVEPTIRSKTLFDNDVFGVHGTLRHGVDTKCAGCRWQVGEQKVSLQRSTNIVFKKWHSSPLHARPQHLELLRACTYVKSVLRTISRVHLC